jgi:hypothetical protein
MFNELQEIIQEALAYGFGTLIMLACLYSLGSRFFNETKYGQKLVEKILISPSDFKNTQGPLELFLSEKTLADNFENLIKFIYGFLLLLTTTTSIFIPSMLAKKLDYGISIFIVIVFWMVINLFWTIAFGTFGIMFNLRKSLADNNKKIDRIESILLNVQVEIDKGKS